MNKHTAEVSFWITEREAIRKHHDAGDSRPWTKDAILGTYRFCNVRREDDRVTKWLFTNWYSQHAKSPNLTAVALLARMVNWPPTLKRMGFPNKLDLQHWTSSIHSMSKDGKKAWGSAYVITTCGVAMDKALYVTGLAERLWGMKPKPTDTLESWFTVIRSYPGLGAGFLAAQVIADLKHFDPVLMNARDRTSFAVPGPGSRRGVNYYYDLPLNTNLSFSDWYQKLVGIRNEVMPKLPRELWDLDMQNMQNVMCECDKMWRARDGRGRPKQHYQPETRF